MRQIFLCIVLVAVTTMACNNKKNEESKVAATDNTTSQMNQPSSDPVKDSADIRNTIIGFYKWYVDNYKKLMSFDLYRSLKKNNAAPYELNKDEVKKYQDFVRDSITQLGAEFDKNLAVMFNKADSAFKVDTKDDVPVYFDYDWYTNSQEDPSWLLDGLNKSKKWVVQVKGDEATVEVGTPDDKNYVSGALLLFVALKRENGQWTIARIGND